MNESQHRRVADLFERALDLDIRARETFLARACADDDAVRREVEELLAIDRETDPVRPNPRSTVLVWRPNASGNDPLSPELAATVPAGHLETPPPGASLGVEGRYELVRLLGSGGMGTVFLAHDRKLDRFVAIKLLHVETMGSPESLLAEARATARCTHENIVVVHDVGHRGGVPYMVLEHLEGASLAERVPRNRERAHPLPPARAVEIMLPVVRALACAHAHGIVHRDLKPDNIFVTDDGVVKVLDFGVAKLVAHADTARGTPDSRTGEDATTEAGAIVGTMPYMSPEQWSGDELGHRADLWAVGIILFELVTGRHPVEPMTPARLRNHALSPDPLPSVRDLTPNIGTLGDIIDRCLQKSPSARFTSADELLSALEQLGPATRHRSRFAGLLIGTAIAVAAVALGLSQISQDRPAAAAPLTPFERSEIGALVAAPAGANRETVAAHRALCDAATRPLDGNVRCVSLPHDEFASHLDRTAESTRAAIAIGVSEGPVARLRLPAGSEISDMAGVLQSPLPDARVDTPDARRQLAEFAGVLARIAALGWSRVDVQLSPDADAIGWQLATTAWYTMVLAGRSSDVDRDAIVAIAANCGDADDRSCALARWLRGLLCPDCPNGNSELVALADDTNTPPTIRDVTWLLIAFDGCDAANDSALAALGEFRDWMDDCRSRLLAHLAQCIARAGVVPPAWTSSSEPTHCSPTALERALVFHRPPAVACRTLGILYTGDAQHDVRSVLHEPLTTLARARGLSLVDEQPELLLAIEARTHSQTLDRGGGPYYLANREVTATLASWTTNAERLGRYSATSDKRVVHEWAVDQASLRWRGNRRQLVADIDVALQYALARLDHGATLLAHDGARIVNVDPKIGRPDPSGVTVGCVPRDTVLTVQLSRPGGDWTMTARANVRSRSVVIFDDDEP